MSITAKELAKKIGLSESSVSIALNGKQGISSETKRYILEQATKYGYDFSRIRNKAFQTKKIALLTGQYFFLSEEKNTIFQQIIEGIEVTLAKEHYILDRHHLRSDQLSDDAGKLIMDLRQNDYDGILVLGADVPKETVSSLSALSVPVVLIDVFYPDLPFSAVTLDNYLGGQIAGDYLCRKYLSEPAYLRCRYRTNGFDRRILGFMGAVRGNAFSRHKVQVYTLSPQIESAFEDMNNLLDSDIVLPRAIFAETDQLALGAAKALLMHGLKIPEDVAIMGFDNLSFDKIFEPSLTSIDYPKPYIGVESARRLMSLINDPTEYKTETQISVSLIKRKSA